MGPMLALHSFEFKSCNTCPSLKMHKTFYELYLRLWGLTSKQYVVLFHKKHKHSTEKTLKGGPFMHVLL